MTQSAARTENNIDVLLMNKHEAHSVHLILHTTSTCEVGSDV